MAALLRNHKSDALLQAIIEDIRATIRTEEPDACEDWDWGYIGGYHRSTRCIAKYLTPASLREFERQEEERKKNARPTGAH